MQLDKEDKEPRTQTKLRGDTPNKKDTTTAIGDSSSIDICIQASLSNILVTGVYIRPTEEDIEKFLHGVENKKTYLFDGFNVNDLNKMVLSALRGFKQMQGDQIGNRDILSGVGVLQYCYFYRDRIQIYDSIKFLH